MSLILNRGTQPKGLKAKTIPVGEAVVFLGDYHITMKDFLELAYYVLTNTNLADGDPRLQFVESVRCMKLVKGYSTSVDGKELDTKRLDGDVPPVLDE